MANSESPKAFKLEAVTLEYADGHVDCITDRLELEDLGMCPGEDEGCNQGCSCLCDFCPDTGDVCKCICHREPVVASTIVKAAKKPDGKKKK